MKTKNKLIVIFVCIVILIIIAATISYFINKKSANKNNETTLNNNVNNISYKENNVPENETQEVDNLQAEDVSDDSEFLTIQNILNKIIIAINSKDTKSLINYMDINFVNDAHITQSSILDNFSEYDFSYYYMLGVEKEKISSNITRYFISLSDAKSVNNPSYNADMEAIGLKIYLDSNNKTFSFTLYKNGITDNITSISKNAYNQFTYIKSTDKLLGQYYLSLFKYLIQNNPQYAYQILSIDDTNSISSYEEFKSYIANTNIDTDNIQVTRTNKDEAQILDIIDGNNNNFKFEIYTYVNFTINLDNSKLLTDEQKYSTIVANYSGQVAGSEITSFMNNFIKTTVDSIKSQTSGLSYNKIREYYDKNKIQINTMGIYSADDYLNLSNQIVGMRWSKGITFMKAYITSKAEEGDYTKLGVKLSYTQDAEINLYLCIAKKSDTTPKIKIETNGVEEE